MEKAICQLHLSLLLFDNDDSPQESAMTVRSTKLRMTLSELRTFELALEFDSFSSGPESFVQHVEAVTRILRMPNLESMRVKLCGGQCLEYLKVCDISFNELFPR